VAPPVRIVLITDRRLMGGDVARFAAAIAAAVRELPARSAIVQVREKDLGGRELMAYARAAVDAAPEQHVVVNERLDVALACCAAGVHLPEDGLDVAAARAAIAAVDGPTPCADMPPFLVGVSRHAAAAVGVEGAHLVQLGPIFETPSKAPYGAPLGVDALTAARAAMAAGVSLVAVGGIDSPARAAAARTAGADAIAVIRAVWAARDPGAAARSLCI
jgi:thiamine-phosphate pyrophosphorylase